MVAPAYSPSSDPIANPSSFYYVLMGGNRTPGIAHVEGNSGSPRKWDERGGYGLTGSTLVFTGKGLAAFDIILELYTSQDWKDWNAFRKTLDLTPQAISKGLDVVHPFLSDYAVTKCVVLDIAWPKQREDGAHEILIPCKAFRKVKFALSKPDSAQAKPTDPVDAQLALKESELSALNQKLAPK